MSINYWSESLKHSRFVQAAISKMDGVGGKPSWAWIFSLSRRFLPSLAVNVTTVIQGLTTVLAGVASFWFIQDFPDSAKFLTETERAFIVRRLQSDDQFSAAGEKFKMKYILKSALDWKTWIGSRLSVAFF